MQNRGKATKHHQFDNTTTPLNKRLVLVTSQQLLDFLGDAMKWTSGTRLAQLSPVGPKFGLELFAFKLLKREYLQAIMFIFCPL